MILPDRLLEFDVLTASLLLQLSLYAVFVIFGEHKNLAEIRLMARGARGSVPSMAPFGAFDKAEPSW